jgi:carbon-monoxide dehydrogenase small subunit
MSAKKISFILNGERKEFEILPSERLLSLLRKNGYKGTKYGCLEGACGTCTVILDGKAVNSCLVFAFQVQDRNVQTIESFGQGEKLHEIQEALVDEGAVQCGYCTPGMVLAAKAMFDENPTPNEEEIKTQIDGNLCRCTGYEKIWSAFNKLSKKHQKGGKK